jgi:hypothetical protein
VGLIVVANYWPPWHREIISTSDFDFNEIVYVNFYSTTDDPSGDQPILSTEGGKLYILSQNHWQLIETFPGEINTAKFINLNNSIGVVTSQNQVFLLQENLWIPYTDKETTYPSREQVPCATQWQHFPSMNQTVIDSDGAIFKHPIADFLRCYVLLADGTLLLMTKQSNVFGAWIVVGVSALLGMLLAGIVQILMRRYQIEQPASIVSPRSGQVF